MYTSVYVGVIREPMVRSIAKPSINRGLCVNKTALLKLIDSNPWFGMTDWREIRSVAKTWTLVSH